MEPTCGVKTNKQTEKDAIKKPRIFPGKNNLRGKKKGKREAGKSRT